MSSLAAGGFVVASGALLLARTLPDFIRGVQSRRWPRHPAIIERVEYAVGSGLRHARSMGGTVTADWFVAYRYAVAELAPTQRPHCSGNCLHFGPLSPREVRDYLAALTPGQPARVAVNPRNHEQSVLVPGPGWWSGLAVGAATAVTISGVIWMFV